jgi:hypothetical protein
VRFALVSGDDGQTPVTAGGSVLEPCMVVYVVIAIIITIAFAFLLCGSPLPHAGHKITLTTNETDGGALPVRGCTSRACSAP